MKYQFVRMQDDGRVSSLIPIRLFDTLEEATKAGLDFLATRRGGGKIVLVEALEIAITTATVRYEKFVRTDAQKE